MSPEVLGTSYSVEFADRAGVIGAEMLAAKRERIGAAGAGGRGRWYRGWALATSFVVFVGLFAVSPAVGAKPASPKFLGPVFSRAESPTVTLGRDAGFSVPLPNGNDFWLFADTPRFVYKNNGWRFAGISPGSTAAMAKYTPGRPLNQPLIEIRPGRKLSASNKPAQFLATPSGVFMPGKPGQACRAAKGSTSPARRWPTGAALMPDKTNILISYAVVCVPSSWYFAAVGWGFTLFNWKTRTFSQRPVDVFPSKPDGSSLESLRLFGSPIIVGKKVTFFSTIFVGAGAGKYTTTVGVALAALKNPASYQPVLLPNVPATFGFDVAPRTARHPRFTMFNLTGTKGEYDIYSAARPTGPWSKVAAGVAPRCKSAPYPCHSFILHPELSPTSRLIVSYLLPGYGPANASKHPHPHEPLRHDVMSSIPCSC